MSDWSSDAELSHAEYVPKANLQPWTEAERDWASGLYQSPGFQAARNRYIAIRKLLDSTRPRLERSRLVKEMHELER